MDSQICRRISCILYRNLVSVFGGFVQFQIKYVTDEASMQDMFSVYMETRSQISFIELYIEFEQSEADQNIEMENYNSDSEKEFESNYECLDPGGDGDQAEDTIQADVADVANALVNKHPFVEPTFMRSMTWRPCIHRNFLISMTNMLGSVQIGPAYRVELLEKVQGSIPAEAYRQHRIFEDGLQNEVFEVREMPSGVEYAVDLRRRVCDCGEFQVDHIPCRHVFACCANQRLDWQVYVHEVYKMDQIRRVYTARFRPLGNPTTWPVYNGPRFVGNPFLRRVAKGRPKMTRFLNEMDTRMLRAPRRCKQCGADLLGSHPHYLPHPHPHPHPHLHRHHRHHHHPHHLDDLLGSHQPHQQLPYYSHE
ncbi:hypothetical protein Ahy_A03g016195 [Arachis hypogaea]|uniref:SWIM-type domain-containing protein n=1 Tax=Arachis hypogaea TaxID=3818 RepID=A0A445E2Q8_ARAHY|nr:hypothetical protein Ahy_A03g016195 [Arachis hypogaea]